MCKLIIYTFLAVFLILILPINANCQSKKSKIVIYYFTFGRSTFAGETAATILTSKYTKEFEDPRQISDILHLVRERYKIAKCNPYKIRLLIKDSRIKNPILVDNDGNVCIGRDEYSLRPSTLVNLYQSMCEIFPNSLAYRKYYLQHTENPKLP